MSEDKVNKKKNKQSERNEVLPTVSVNIRHVDVFPSGTNLICRLSIDSPLSSLILHEENDCGWQKVLDMCCVGLKTRAGTGSKAVVTEDRVSPAGCEETDAVGGRCS